MPFRQDIHKQSSKKKQRIQEEDSFTDSQSDECADERDPGKMYGARSYQAVAVEDVETPQSGNVVLSSYLSKKNFDSSSKGEASGAVPYISSALFDSNQGYHEEEIAENAGQLAKKVVESNSPPMLQDSLSSLESPLVGNNDQRVNALQLKLVDAEVDKMLDVKTSPVKYLEESNSKSKSSGLKLDHGSGLKLDRIMLNKIDSESDQDNDTPLHEIRMASYVKDSHVADLNDKKSNPAHSFN